MSEGEEQAFSRYAYGLLHDLKGSLRGANHLLRWLERDPGPAAAAPQLPQLRERLKRQEGLLDELADYLAADRPGSAWEELALEPLLRELSVEGDVPLRLELPAEGLPRFEAPPDPLRRLLSRLLAEARRQARGQATALRVRASAEAGRVRLSFDGGPPSGSPGRDLLIAERIAKAHGANLEWESAADGRWTLRLDWPRGDKRGRMGA